MITLFGIVGFLLILVIGISMMTPMMAAGMTLAQPIDCRLGRDCFIQNYVDLDAGKNWQDYQCGPLSYDGHKGTDFRLKSLAQMREGVAVLSALDGKVIAVRDGMPDRSFRAADATDVDGKECGNGVVMEHRGNLHTQYCHLRAGSITVSQGQRVAKGAKLGLVGLSGKTEFPHVHFELRQKDGTIIDPFSGALPEATCNAPHTPRWQPNLRDAMAYRPTALLSSGFASRMLTAEQARDGSDHPTRLPRDADMLLFWVDVMGMRAGDDLVMQLIGPDGIQLVNHSVAIDGNKAQWFQYIGKKRIEAQWPEGTYIGRLMVERDTAEGGTKRILDETSQIDVIDPDAPDNRDRQSH